MSDYIDITWTGDKKLQAKLKRLELGTQRKVVRGALRKAMKPVKDRARELVPVDSGRLRDSIKQRSRTRRGVSRALVVTGTRDELGIAGDAKGYYPAVIEYGTRDRTAKPYLRRALAEQASSVIGDAAGHIADGIEREAKK